MATLRVRLLGGFVITYDDQVVTSVNTARLQSLLAYLVLHRDTPQSRQHVAFALWPDSTEEQARTNLRKILSQLRQAWPAIEGFVNTEGQTLQCPASLLWSSDVAEFEEAVASGGFERAVALYSGDLLPDCYDEWIRPKREHLSQLFVGAAEKAIAALENRREYRAAIAQAQRLLQYDPLSEATYCTLMRLHSLNGDRSSVLRTYQSCEQTLKREFGFGPSPETIEFYERLSNSKAFAPLERGHSMVQPLKMPLPFAPLIGREAEFDAVLKLMSHAETRLVTLTGPGGVGKTSLARKVASHLARSYDSGGAWVELASLTDADQVMPTIARTLGMVLDTHVDVLQRVIDFLSGASILLVLDNMEHVLSASAQIVALLDACPAVDVLITSRVPLHLRNEHCVSVAPFSAELSERLFVERAREARPNLTLDEAARAAVHALCAHLDGLPLAIELVAARIALMSPQAALAHFVSNQTITLRLVADGVSELPLRQRTLQGTIQWSINLLVAEHQRAFRYLSAFSNGFDLDAAVQVACLSGPFEQDRQPEPEQQVEAWNALKTLLDANLLAQRERLDAKSTEHEPDFYMLETIRVAARAELERTGEAGDADERHACYFESLADECVREYEQSHNPTALRRIRSSMPDVLAAIQYAISQGQAERACHLCESCGSVWKDFAYQAEGLVLTEAALALTGTDQDTYLHARAGALITLVSLSANTTDHTRTRMCCDESLALYRAIGDERGIWMASHQRAWHCYLADGGWALHNDLLDAIRRTNDAYWTAIKLTDLAVLNCYIKSDGSDFTAALGFLDEAIGRFEALNNDEGLCYALRIKGGALGSLSRFDEASDVLHRALRLGATGSLKRLADIEEALGSLSLWRSDTKAAVQHCARSVQLSMQLGSPLGQHTAMTRQGIAEIAEGLTDEAVIHLRRALVYFDTSTSTSFESYFGVLCRIGLAQLAGKAGRKEEAADFMHAAQTMINARSLPFDTYDRKLLEDTRHLIQ